MNDDETVWVVKFKDDYVVSIKGVNSVDVRNGAMILYQGLRSVAAFSLEGVTIAVDQAAMQFPEPPKT